MTYKIDHIKMTTPYSRRPGTYMQPEYITIHNTGNERSTAANERAWLTNPTNKVTASYHIVIDEKETIECLPLNEVGWHAGDGKNGPGNRKSIGIEICESGNYVKTLERAVELVAGMLKERGWGVDRLRRHYDWSGKNCPRLMNADGNWTGWYEFVGRVKRAMEPKKEQKTPYTDVPAGHWAEGAIKEAGEKGLLNGYPDGTYRPDKPVTRAELAAVLSGLK